MRLVIVISFLVTFLFLSSTTLAIQYYGIETVLSEDGNSKVKLTITFDQPRDSFNFNVFGRIKNFNATSSAGPVVCDVKVSGISSVNCSLALTIEKRTLEISFETVDFVKILDNRYLFSNDFSLREEVDQIFVLVRLPENMAVIKEDVPGKISYSEYAVLTNNDNVIIWTFFDITKFQSLKLDVLYERVQPPLIYQLRIRYILIFAIVVAVILSFVVVRYLKKSEKLVLSVLDGYERKIMDVLMASGGETSQKKIVQETNLSKAKVSRVINTLSNRGLVQTERRGRTNIVRLVKKKLTT